MDRGLIRRWNSVVTRYDTVYHLGDFCFARTRSISSAMHIYGDAMHMVREEEAQKEGFE